MSATQHAVVDRQSRAVLVSVPVVRHETGLRRDEIFDRVDGKSLLHPGLIWVWNFAVNPKGDVRDLRFYIRELAEIERRLVVKAELDDVINMILPKSRRDFHSGELIEKFMLSRPTLLALRDELNGNLIGAHNVLFARENVAKFLKNRWLGAHGVTRPTLGGSR